MSSSVLYAPEKATKYFLNDYICTACDTEFYKIAKKRYHVFLLYPKGSKPPLFLSNERKSKLIKNGCKFDNLKEHLN